MGKIKLHTEGTNTTMKLPGELVYYLLNKNINNRRSSYRVSISKIEHVPSKYNLVLTISNYWYDARGERSNYNRGQTTSFRKRSLKFSDTFDIPWKYIDKSYRKSNGRLGMSGRYEVDYTIIEEGEYFTIISYFNIGETLSLPDYRDSGFVTTADEVFSGRYSGSYISSRLKKHSDEFFHFVKFDVDTITYVTRDKFYDVLLNNGRHDNTIIRLNEEESLNVFGKHVRTISLSKFMIRLFPDHDARDVQRYLEYNKMLSNYDPAMFSIVTGSDISKYYDVNNYYTATGDLGSSCMRHDIKQYVVKFYDNNKNVSLIIIKPSDTDSIIGRALLWTTTDGTKIMDRIYTSNSKLVSLFHKYAAENGFINVYEIRKHSRPKERDITAMSPSNWLADYDRNYTVDLDWVPEKLLQADNRTKFYKAFMTRSVSMSDPYDMPYIDNFNLVNLNSMQLSLLPIADTFKCPISDTYLTVDNYVECKGEVYNTYLVSIRNSNPVLMSDTVELDSPTEDEETAYVDSDEFDDDEFDDDYTDEELEEVTGPESLPEIVIPVGEGLLHQINNEARLITYVNERATPQAILDYFGIAVRDLDFSSNR